MRLVARALALRALTFATTSAGAVLAVGLCFATLEGDAIDLLPNGPELRAQLAAEWGLEGGVGQRLAGALSRAARFDFGTSLSVEPGTPVATLMWSAGARSARLLLPALVLALLAGFGGALLAGAAGERTPPPWRTRVVRLLSAASALPTVLAVLGVVSVGNHLTWQLVEGGHIDRPAWFALPETDHPVRTLIAVVLLAGASAAFAWSVARASHTLSDLAARPFVAAERARGGPVGWLFLRHMLVPAARMSAAQLPLLLSALVVVERGIGMPGAGSLFWLSCGQRDWPLAVGLAVLAALVATTARFMADTLAVLLDPRERDGLA
jgi:peptide/nickel transport system permease protein